jgi:hypothetical protein
LNPVDDLALVIGLAKLYGKSMSLRRRPAKLLDVGKRGMAVELRLALAEQIKIGSDEDVDRFRHTMVRLTSARTEGSRAGPFIGKGPAKGKPE